MHYRGSCLSALKRLLQFSAIHRIIYALIDGFVCLKLINKNDKQTHDYLENENGIDYCVVKTDNLRLCRHEIITNML